MKRPTKPSIDPRALELDEPIWDTIAEHWVFVKRVVRKKNDMLFVKGLTWNRKAGTMVETAAEAGACTMCWNPNARCFGRGPTKGARWWIPRHHNSKKK